MCPRMGIVATPCSFIRIHRSVEMAGLLKKTTGLTGLAVLPNPHKNLMVVYDKILRTLKKMPADTAYRRHTEVIIQERLGHVKAEPNIAKLEARIQGGQIEEVLLQAEKELSLARKFLQWKPWEPLLGDAPPNQWKWPIGRDM